MQNFNINTKIYFGENSLEYLKTLNTKNVFIVCDPFLVNNGTLDKLKINLKTENILIFSDVKPDPDIEVVSNGIAKLKDFNPELIIAMGGGSVIDATKAMMEFGKNILNLGKVEFVVIPTTSGTGSEVTNFSVITDAAKGVKYPLVSDSLLPNVAILDPEFTKTVPPHITADTGMDVLTHSIEAYVSTKANDFSDALALKAINLVFENLELCFKDGMNTRAREKMHNASCLAGMAFNNTSLGINHSVAHIIGGKYHLAHGRINTLLMPHIIEYNAGIEGYDNNFSETAKRYADIAKSLGIAKGNVRSSVKALMNKIVQLQKAMNMPLSLKEMQVDLSNFDEIKAEMAEVALNDKCTATNPVQPTKEDIIKILDKVRG